MVYANTSAHSDIQLEENRITQIFGTALEKKLIHQPIIFFSHMYAYTVCPTRYRTRYFFNNFNTNEVIATKFEAGYRHIPLHFSHNERTPVQISLQYLHCCYNY